MELIDDWGEKKRVPPKPGSKATEPASAKAIGKTLASFEPPILSLHCYKDVGHPWVQVGFDHLIDPGLALRVGHALAEVAGPDRVYVNSLRPRAVCFVLAPAFDPDPDLPVSRYGDLLADIEKLWKRR